jgi:molecular chaperone HtpG
VVQIIVNGNSKPLTRPHRDQILKRDGDVLSTVSGVSEINFPEMSFLSAEDKIAGWYLEHDYPGALPLPAQVRGLRTRIGNMQIGSEQLWDNVFKEIRFNLWHVGEFNIQAKSIKPNTRRDALTPSPDVDNLTNCLNIVATELSNICRRASSEREQGKRLLHKQVNLGKKEYNKILSQLKVGPPVPERVTLSIGNKEK